MPEKVHGESVDEEKWEKAKQRADEQGHGGEYDYIMGIYKRMAGLDKSSRDVDSGTATPHTESKRRKLVLKKHQTTHQDVRCPKCGILLMKATVRAHSLLKSMGGGEIEIKCKRCKALVSI